MLRQIKYWHNRFFYLELTLLIVFGIAGVIVAIIEIAQGQGIENFRFWAVLAGIWISITFYFWISRDSVKSLRRIRDARDTTDDIEKESQSRD